jgi:hypothetical protein
MLEGYPGYVEFTGRSAAKSREPHTIDEEVATPEERLQAAYEELSDPTTGGVADSRKCGSNKRVQPTPRVVRYHGQRVRLTR